MSSLEPGVVVADRYEILSLIKAGGMGAVYQARDVQGGPVVALKEMLQSFSFHVDRNLIYHKFEEEGRLLRTLDHPNIPRVLAHFAKDELYYIVMEYIEGESLEQLLEDYLMLTRRPMPAQLVVECALLLCPILTYLHARQPRPIIHRDIKPGNIILRKNRSEVVLVDFGLARDISSNQLTQSPKTMVGTLGYAPLEQLKGLPEIRSDLFALGATMHHLLSGRVPKLFESEPVENLTSDLPAELIALVNRATQEDPNLRFQSASEMELALSHILSTWKPVSRLSMARTLVRGQTKLSRTSRITIPHQVERGDTGRLASESAPLADSMDAFNVPHTISLSSHSDASPSPSAGNLRAVPETAGRRRGLRRVLLPIGAALVFAGGLGAGLLLGPRHDAGTPTASPTLLAPSSSSPDRPPTSPVNTPTTELTPPPTTYSPGLSVDPLTSSAPYRLLDNRLRSPLTWKCITQEGVVPEPSGTYLAADHTLGNVVFSPVFEGATAVDELSFSLAADSGHPPFLAWIGNCGVLFLPSDTMLPGVHAASLLQWKNQATLQALTPEDLRGTVLPSTAYARTIGLDELGAVSVKLGRIRGHLSLNVDLEGRTAIQEQASLPTPWTSGSMGCRVLGRSSTPLHLEDLHATLH